VFVTDIERGIPIGISTMATRTTDKRRLALTVTSVNETASVALLTGMARIDSDHTAAQCFGLVFKEAFELRERPGVKSSLGLSPPRLHSRSNVGQVLHHDGGSRRDALQNALAQYVIAIPSEPCVTAREASKVALGALRAFGLQFSLQAEAALADFTPALLAVHPSVRCHGGAADAQINTNRLPVVHELGRWDTQADMKRKSPLAVDQIGRAYLVTSHRLGVGRDIEVDLLAAGRCGQVDNTSRPVDFERANVEPWRAEHGRRAVDLAALLTARYSGLDRLRCLLASLNMQVRIEIWYQNAAIAIGQFMKRVGIAFTQPPSFSANMVKRYGKLLHRFKQDFRLLWCRF